MIVTLEMRNAKGQGLTKSHYIPDDVMEDFKAGKGLEIEYDADIRAKETGDAETFSIVFRMQPTEGTEDAPNESRV